MRSPWRRAVLLPLLPAAAVLLGCGPSGGGLKPQQQQMANRLDTITKQSGGDWNKVSETDREYLIKSIGSEQSARMLIAAGAGHLKASPGGPRQP